MQTIEEQLGISAAGTEAAAEPDQDFSSISEFLVANEETGEQEFQLGVADVAKLKSNQIDAVLAALGLTASGPDQKKRQVIVAALKKLGGGEEAPAEEAAEEEAPAEETGEYNVGDVVVVRWAADGSEWDPCRIDKVIKARGGKVRAYDVYFDQTKEMSEIPAEDIVGYSEQTIEE